MIQIQLKARHFYYIIYYIQDASIKQYYSLINRLKIALAGDPNSELIISVNCYAWEVVNIYKILTSLPEGQAAMINAEMDDLLEPQIVTGVTSEMMAGISPSPEGNIPENAPWQQIADGITQAKQQSAAIKNQAIDFGKIIIEEI